MSRIIIHIGTHKTATSYIQNIFRNNRGLLKKHNIIYPLVHNKLGHHALAGLWNKTQLPARGFDPKRAWQDLSTAYADTDYTVFVSSEELSRMNVSSRVNMAQLRHMLADFDQIQLIYTLRNQASFLQSVYQQISSQNTIEHHGNFINKALKTNLANGLTLNYNRFYSLLIDGFARTEIRLISYDTAVKEKGGILGAFLRELNTDLQPQDFKPIQNNHANISPSPLATLLGNNISAPMSGSPELVAQLQTCIEQNLEDGYKTTIFTADEVATFDQEFHQSNTELRKRVHFYQPDFEIGPMLGAGPFLYRNELTTDFWVSICRALAPS